jgi:hypothetical protein
MTLAATLHDNGLWMKVIAGAERNHMVQCMQAVLHA